MDRGADQVAAQGRAVDEHDLDQEIQAMKRHVLEMEAQLHHFPINVEWPHGPRQHQPRAAPAVAIDDNSIYIGQVDYSTTAEDLVALFHRCGPIMRVTVVCDKATGQPKGYAYIEFATPDAAQSALALNETPFRGRQIKVTTKRVNERGFNGAGRGRGDRSEHPSGRGGGRRGGCNVGSPRGPSGRGGGRGGGRSPPPSRGGRGISHDGDLSLSADAAGSGSTGNPPLGPGGRVVYL